MNLPVGIHNGRFFVEYSNLYSYIYAYVKGQYIDDRPSLLPQSALGRTLFPPKVYSYIIPSHGSALLIFLFLFYFIIITMNLPIGIIFCIFFIPWSSK